MWLVKKMTKVAADVTDITAFNLKGTPLISRSGNKTFLLYQDYKS